MTSNNNQFISEEDRAFKNSIFAAKAAKEAALQGGYAGGGAQGGSQRQLGIEVPCYPVPIPSAGKLYGAGSPLCDVDSVEIKAMTAKEENILMSRALVRKGTVITELIKSCLIDKDIDVNSMISGDRNALMIAIRITGYGKDYSPRVTCPACEQQQDFMFDLSALELKELDLTKVEQVEPNTNQFKFTLPNSKKDVVFKFLTGKEEETIFSILEAKKKKGIQNDEVITTRLIQSVISIDGDRDRSYIAQFLSNMLARDSLALRMHIDENEPSVDMKQDFICNSCGYQEVMAVQMGPTFLWPGTKS